METVIRGAHVCAVLLVSSNRRNNINGERLTILQKRTAHMCTLLLKFNCDLNLNKKNETIV